MAVEYNGDKIVLRDSSGNQMSVPRFFQLAIRNEEGTHQAQPSSGLYRNDSTEFHGAWDMGTAGASDVIARTPAGGTVVYVGGAGGFGPNLVIIKEDDYERYHYFGHMASAAIQQGDIVQQGDKVGIVGGYGGSAGNWNPNAYAIHLHYEVMTKNIMVSGGTSHDKEFVLDPMDVFDESTLPSGWIYGYNPQTKPTNYAAKAYNWDYIELDKTATDFGPSGGVEPAEPFFTDKCCYDVSTYQNSSKVSQLVNDSTTGGIIIRAGVTGGSKDDKAESHLAACKAAGIPVGFYFACYTSKDSEGTWEALKSVFETCFGWLSDIGASPVETKLGVWLDMESGFTNSFSASNSDNLETVRLFNEVGTEKGYPVVGLYTNKGPGLETHFDKQGGIENYPFWYSRPGVSRSTVDSEIQEWGFQFAYLWQDGFPDNGGIWSPGKTYYHQDVDNDTVLQPMPIAGTGGGGGGSGSGGSTTEVIKITVDVIPPKRIYFSPVPGLINADSVLLNKRTAIITISTDADNADLYYTIDGSSPYQYTYDGDIMVYALAANAQKYTTGITINKDTHIRVIAVPAGTVPGGDFDKPLAKGSGTYLFSYHDVIQDWEAEKKSYATSDNNTSFFEENKQAFLRLHDSQTSEEVLYAAVYRHNTQSQAEDAKDNASTTGETQPDSNSMSDGITDDGGSEDVSDE